MFGNRELFGKESLNKNEKITLILVLLKFLDLNEKTSHIGVISLSNSLSNSKYLTQVHNFSATNKIEFTEENEQGFFAITYPGNLS